MLLSEYELNGETEEAKEPDFLDYGATLQTLLGGEKIFCLSKEVEGLEQFQDQ